MNSIQCISVPFRSGCNREGAQRAPEKLCQRLNIDSLVLPLQGENVPLNDEEQYGVKNYAAVLNMCCLLRDTVDAVWKKGRPVVVVGGDHSLGLGSVAGALMNEPNLGLIWFDAHGDINTESTSPSGNAHGMPVAALLGLCKSELNDVAVVRLKAENVFWVGARDLDKGEEDILEQLGIRSHVYSAEQVHQLGMAAVMDEIRQHMAKQGGDTLHVSFDIDGMDPSIVGATGTRVPCGLMQNDFDAFVEALPTLPRMHSLDFVEYNPLMEDEEQSTLAWCADALVRLMEQLG